MFCMSHQCLESQFNTLCLLNRIYNENIYVNPSPSAWPFDIQQSSGGPKATSGKGLQLIFLAKTSITMHFYGLDKNKFTENINREFLVRHTTILDVNRVNRQSTFLGTDCLYFHYHIHECSWQEDRISAIQSINSSQRRARLLNAQACFRCRLISYIWTSFKSEHLS